MFSENQPPADKIAKKNDVLKKVLKYGTNTERKDAIKVIALFQERDPALVKQISALIPSEPDPLLRITAISSLVTMEETAEVKKLIPLLHDENEDIQKEVVSALRKLKITEAIPELLALLQKQDLKKNSNLSASIIQTLADIDSNHSALSFLTDKFRDAETDNQIRAQIALYYGSTKSLRSELLLIDTANDKREDTTVRCYAINSLGKLDSKKSIPHLKNILEETKKPSAAAPRQVQTLKIYTLSTLVKLGDKSVKEELFVFARDDDAVVRLRAISFLKDLNDPDVIELLEYKALRDPSMKVQNAAKKALQELKEKK